MTVGICSWSLQPTSPAELVAGIESVGVRHVQLALEPFRHHEGLLESTRAALDAAGITILSGMMATVGEDYSSLASIRVSGGLRPDEHWDANRRAAAETARIAQQLGLSLVSFHAGFLPEDATDPERARLLDRLREVADLFAARELQLTLETGQESAPTLLGVLEELDHPALGVNFDPANMLLYDMGDPVAALDLLAPHVRQLHIKDARRSPTPGEWGCEVPVGEGEVDWTRFFEVYRRHDLSCDLVIEREAGEQRVRDALTALALLSAHGMTEAAP